MAKEKHVTIIVNTRPREWDKETISYEEVVALAFNPPDPNTVYTVDFSNGPHGHTEGTLTKGRRVPVAQGMIFNVTPTGKS
jgi:hypothetical protein